MGNQRGYLLVARYQRSHPVAQLLQAGRFFFPLGHQRLHRAPFLLSGKTSHHFPFGFLHRYRSSQHVPHSGRANDGVLQDAAGSHCQLVGDAAGGAHFAQAAFQLPAEPGGLGERAGQANKPVPHRLL
jgi:hypothetical protein